MTILCKSVNQCPISETIWWRLRPNCHLWQVPRSDDASRFGSTFDQPVDLGRRLGTFQGVVP